MSDLKPCPFCGAAADLLPEGQVECSNEDCLVHVMSAAANDWNHRASGWIACSERLPPIDKYVLLFTDEAFMHPGFYACGEFLFQGYERGALGLGEVTHWQPLPEPPK